VSQPALAPLAAEPASAVAPSAAAASSAPATQAAPPIAREQHARAGGSPDALRAEIALLDNARVALREGSGERALDALARHARRFPHGTLSPEADALRVEALIQTGATDRARALSRRFFANYPNSPLAERVARAVSSQPAR
jgi:TolA-binding protein